MPGSGKRAWPNAGEGWAGFVRYRPAQAGVRLDPIPEASTIGRSNQPHWSPTVCSPGTNIPFGKGYGIMPPPFSFRRRRCCWRRFRPSRGRCTATPRSTCPALPTPSLMESTTPARSWLLRRPKRPRLSAEPRGLHRSRHPRPLWNRCLRDQCFPARSWASPGTTKASCCVMVRTLPLTTPAPMSLSPSGSTPPVGSLAPTSAPPGRPSLLRLPVR